MNRLCIILFLILLKSCVSSNRHNRTSEVNSILVDVPLCVYWDESNKPYPFLLSTCDMKVKDSLVKYEWTEPGMEDSLHINFIDQQKKEDIIYFNHKNDTLQVDIYYYGNPDVARIGTLEFREPDSLLLNQRGYIGVDSCGCIAPKRIRYQIKAQAKQYKIIWQKND